MCHRKLTEACVFALRSVAPRGDVYNRTVAANLRVVEKFFPEFVIITPPPHSDHVGARPLFGAIVTDRGLEFITPKKVARAARRSHPHEARP